jgi:hypothetical protein
MACTTDHYDATIGGVVGLFIGAVDWLTPYLGKPIALVATFVLMLPLALLLSATLRVLVPALVQCWYDETIAHRSREYWRRKCVGTGITMPGARLSIVLGFVCFLLVRFAASVPAYYRVTVPLLIAAFIGVAVIGYFMSGNVPETDAARNKYFRKFQAPTVTGFALGAVTVVWDFLVHAGSVALTYLQAT